MHILWTILVMFLTLQFPVHASSVVTDGELDLQEHPLQELGPLELKGTWNFYWQAFYSPDELEAYKSKLIQTPGAWGNQSLDIDNHGYGTYHLRIDLADQDVGQTLGLYLPSIASAYVLYMNGEKMAEAGKIGTFDDEMIPAALPQTIFFTPTDPILDVVVHVSNFTQRKGGIWDSLMLGTAQQIVDEREQRILFQAFIATGLFLMGVYHMILYFYRSEKSVLFFGLASLLLSLRMLCVGEMLFQYLIPSIPWEIIVKFEYLSVFWGISFFVLYFYYLYPHDLHFWTSYMLALCMISVSLPVVFLPAKIFTEWMLFYQLIVIVQVLFILVGLIRAVFHRRRGSVLNLIAGMFFLTTVFNDILYYNFVLDSIDLVTLGLFLFVFTQMFMLSNKFVSDFHEVKLLKHRLEESNEQLEDLVSERTKALRFTNAQLIKAQHERKQLLSSISHELGNLLTTVTGNLAAIKRGKTTEADHQHVHKALQKMMKLERLTDDLRQLIKLDNKQLSFHFQKIKLKDFFDELQQVYDWDMLHRNIEILWDINKMDDIYVCVDMGRIEQVFVNIVNNALDYTKSHERITIKGRYFDFAKACLVEVTDTGIGIRQEEQKKLFNRFYRGKNMESARKEGVGLGLAISKGIMEAHHGILGVRSQFGQGSSFYFILPVWKGGQHEGNDDLNCR